MKTHDFNPAIYRMRAASRLITSRKTCWLQWQHVGTCTMEISRERAAAILRGYRRLDKRAPHQRAG